MGERLSDERLQMVAEFDNGDWIATDTLLSLAEAASMARELVELRALCDEIYQVVGVLAHQVDVFSTPEVERAMNNLVAASNGSPLPHETLLPFGVKAAGPVMPDVPSDVMRDIVEDCLSGFGTVYQKDVERVWEVIRSALMQEQNSRVIPADPAP